MRMTTNEEEVEIDWVEGGAFPDQKEASFAIVYPNDLVPNLVYEEDTVGTLGEWIHWMEQFINKRREDLNEGLDWSIDGISVPRDGAEEDHR